MSLMIDTLSENVAAISASVHSAEQYKHLYAAIKEEVSGFPGIWQLCSEIGQAFTEAEYSERHIAGYTYEWMDAIDDIVGRIFDVCINGDGPHSVSWKREAHAAITANSY